MAQEEDAAGLQAGRAYDKGIREFEKSGRVERGRPSMRFVPVNRAQQDIQALHRVREQLIRNRQRWSTKRAGYWARMGSWWHKESAVFSSLAKPTGRSG